MSGRRSSNSEGRPTGIAGGGIVRGMGARLKDAGGLPIKTATACSYCARATPISIACARVVSIGDSTRGPMVRDSVSCCTGARIDRGEKIGSLIAELRASLRVLGRCRLQVLVRDVDLRLEGIQLGVLKHFPPIAAEGLVIRLGRFPIANLFIGGRNLRGWAAIFRTNGASGDQEQAGEADAGQSTPPNPNRCVRAAS